MWTLADLSKIEVDPLRKSVIDTLLMESDLMQLLPWETTGTLSTTVTRWQTLPTWGYRRVNAAFDESTGTFEQKTESVALGGLDIDTDVVIARAKNTIAEARSLQQYGALKSAAYSFNNLFINGDLATDIRYFPGLKRRVDDLVSEGYAGQKIQCNDVDTGINNSSTTALAFVDDLDKLCDAIDGHNPDFLLMNLATLRAVRSALRRAQLLNQSQDMFGRKIDMYGNTRMVAIGTLADQTTEIITTTETTAGASGGSECTSIYAVKFGIGMELWGIQMFPIEVRDFGELQTAPVYRTRVEWPHGLAAVSPRSIARMYGIVPDTSA